MRQRRRVRILAHTALVLVCLVFLIPVFWMFNLSIKSDAEVSALPTVWWPEVPQWQNYAEALSYIDFFGFLRNSVIITTITTVLTVLFSSLTAFAFAKLRAPGKRILFGIMMSTMMLPSIVTTIPLYIMYSKVNLVDTYIPWVLMGIAGSAYMVFLIRQYMTSIPAEVEEAAILDGCSYFQIWYRMYLPLCKPALAAAAVLTFVWSWGDFIMPMLLLSSDKTTLAVALTTGYVDQMMHPIQPLIAAGSLMFALPVIVVFLFLQKFFVEGFATSGVK